MNKTTKIFLFSIPLLVMFGTGVFHRSTKEAVPPRGCFSENLSGIAEEKSLAIFEGAEIVAPRIAQFKPDSQVLSVVSPNERWIEVDLSEQWLRAWDGDQIFLETAISSGLPKTPTPTGEFQVWVKLRSAKMQGGQGRNYYYLPNVPFVMYFENERIPGWRGYGLYGTYWHNDFGRPRSHGCVNLPTAVAERLYYWATPSLPANKSSVFASPDNPGMRVIIHD